MRKSELAALSANGEIPELHCLVVAAGDDVEVVELKAGDPVAVGPARLLPAPPAPT